MDYFKQGQLELSALAVSVGSTFRTDIPCLETEHEMMLISEWRKLFMALSSEHGVLESSALSFFNSENPPSLFQWPLGVHRT